MQKLKRVLIITYYWPPSGGPGVQRCLYFVKYLKEFGWEPVIYTVENGEFPYHDLSLEKEIPFGVEIIKHKAWEPFSLYKRIMGMPKTEKLKPNLMVEKSKRPFLLKISTFIRGNFFIPDARMFWIKPSVRFLKSYLKENPVDLILSSSPPHSVQMIAYHLKNDLDLPWISDLRDPWTKIFFWDKLRMSSYARHKNAVLEQKVLKTADRVVTVSNACAVDFEKLSDRKVDIITNGFDQIIHNQSKHNQDEIIICYGGTLSFDRNPALLWKALNEYIKLNHTVQKVKLQFIGAIDQQIFDSIKANGLADYLEHHQALSHEEYLKKIGHADILLLIGAPNQPGVITGKFFEYLALKKPILSICPKGSDAELILNETKSGFNADFEDEQSIAKILEKIINLSQNLDQYNPIDSVIDQFSRKNLTGKLSKIMDELV